MAEKINLYDFTKMHINLALVEEGKTVLDTFPELRPIKAYQDASDIEIRVAILMCDRDGPFSRIKKFDERLRTIFEWHKLDFEGKQQEFYQLILDGKQNIVAEIWTVYLAALFDHEWTSWFSNSLLYYQLMAHLRKPIEITNDREFDKQFDKRMKIEARADSIYKRMKEMEAIIFIDEVIKKKAVEREKNKIENFAEKFADENSVI